MSSAASATPRRRPDPGTLSDIDIEALRLFREAQGPGAAAGALLLRGLRALCQALPHMDDEARAFALSRPSDEEAVAIVLAALPSPADPLQRARMRGYERVRQLSQAEGGCLTAQEVAELLNVTRQGVDWKRKSRHLLAASLPGRRGWMYPAWQLAGGAPLVGMDLLLTRLEEAGVEGWAAVHFFLAPMEGTQVRPLDALRLGDIGPVLRVASLMREQGPL